MRTTITYIWMISSCLLLAACNSSDSDSSGTKTGSLAVSLTDGPVMADAVVIHFTSATVQPADGDRIEVEVTDPDDPSVTGRSIDLLKFTGDSSTVLFDTELPAGNYSWIRLNVDFDPAKTYITTATGDHALNCTSCGNNGLMLNRSFNVSADNTMAFMLDFELGQSVTEANGNYKLRPTVRIIDTAAAGNISGNVDPTLIAVLEDANPGCMVYVYEGSDVEPDDIYIPNSGNAPQSHNNPVSTTPVDMDTHTYTAAFLPAGDYTVSLTCDTDDALTLDTLEFYGTENASITAGVSTEINFAP